MTTKTLLAGKDTDVGTVSVEQNNGTLTVTYSLADDNEWRIVETNLHVGDRKDVTNKGGNPKIGKFSHQYDYGAEGGVRSAQIAVDASDLDGEVDILAHAALEQVVESEQPEEPEPGGEPVTETDHGDENEDEDDGEETATLLSEGAWADGERVKPPKKHPRHPGRYIDGGNWATYFVYNLSADAE